MDFLFAAASASALAFRSAAAFAFSRSTSESSAASHDSRTSLSSSSSSNLRLPVAAATGGEEGGVLLSSSSSARLSSGQPNVERNVAMCIIYCSVDLETEPHSSLFGEQLVWSKYTNGDLVKATMTHEKGNWKCGQLTPLVRHFHVCKCVENCARIFRMISDLTCSCRNNCLGLLRV